MSEASLTPPRLILASRSPRRAMLLRDAGYDFEQTTPPFDDTGCDEPHLSPQDLAIALAQRKSESFADRQPPNTVVLCADTLCVGRQGEQLGKPTSRDHARAMIRSFVNTDHPVITGIALRTPTGTIQTLADTTTVTLGDLSNEDLEAYLATDDWHDKAGGYNLFDRQASGWPITVQGDPTTVVGLPMDKLSTVLPALGIHPKSITQAPTDARTAATP